MTEYLDLLPTWLADPTVGKLVAAALTVVVIAVLTRLAQRGASNYVADKTSRYRVRKSISFLGYAAGALAVFSVFSDRLAQLTVVFGVAGAGIAFALQEVIASIAGWSAISFGGFYKVGDRVELGGIRGDVVDIGVLRTTLAEVGQWVNGDLYNGRMVRVANSFVFKEPVVNYSGDFPFLWDEFTVPIRFGSNLKDAEALMRRVVTERCSTYQVEAAEIWKQMAEKYPLERASTEPSVTLVFDENWVTFTIRYTVRFDRRRSTKHTLSVALLDELSRCPTVSLAAAAVELVPTGRFVVEPPQASG